MREENWQALVGPAICQHLNIKPELLYSEVQTRDGSIADLAAVVNGDLIIFELKMAQLGEVVAALSARSLRQLRHYRDAADAVYLVTLVSPRTYNFVDGRVIVREPLEAQLLPDGVGWMGFDLLTRQLVVLSPAPELRPKRPARTDFLDKILARLSKATRQAQRCRACPI